MATVSEAIQIDILKSVEKSKTTVIDAIESSSIIAKLNSLIAAVNAKTPILKSSVSKMSEILTADIPANVPKRLFAANPNRIGYFVYNNSTNSLYGGPTNSPAGGRIFFQLASNAGPTALISFLGPVVWTGEIWVIRNGGAGGVVGLELEL